MLSLVQLIAILSTALFAGAALYVSLVEHPARMRCSIEVAVAEFVPSYKRASIMQALLAIIGFVASVFAWLRGAGPPWLVAAVLIVAVVPFTLIVIMPTNKQLMTPGLDLSSPATRELLIKWGRLHAVRTALSLIALLILIRQVVS